MADILRIKSIAEFHRLLGLPKPEHPLISFIREKEVLAHFKPDDRLFNIRYYSDMYTIVYKDKISGSLEYGRSTYDFQEGTIIFSSPGQVFTSPSKEQLARWREVPVNRSPLARTVLREPMLPPALPHLRERVTLVLDIDETLLHASFDLSKPYNPRLMVEVDGAVTFHKGHKGRTFISVLPVAEAAE